MAPHGYSLRVTPWTCKRQMRKLFVLSKPAQVGLEPQHSAPRGPLRLQPGGAGSAAPA